MLDSFFTLTKGAALWAVIGIVICVAIDRLIALITGMLMSLFLLFALAIAAWLLVSAIYTGAKHLLKRTQTRT